ncbi:GNAT family N-acetyltransferase [Streptomyces sp. NPDC051909]|uniref:GNAT family N-acetyltransferase n=1 Tax=Streptomyces sp. NPDC051909 TaxID=3154944 RepID=UPI00341948B7
MNDLRVRLAAEPDLPTLVRLRDAAARWMLARGVTRQWQPGELDEEHFRRVMAGDGEVWIAESVSVSVSVSVSESGSESGSEEGGVVGAWELWWDDEAAWGVQPPVAGYVHRLMVDRTTAAPGTGRRLLTAAEHRVAATGRTHVRLDCLADNAPLNTYYRNAGYRPVGRVEGKPQPGGPPKSFTLMEKVLAPPRSVRCPL